MDWLSIDPDHYPGSQKREREEEAPALVLLLTKCLSSFGLRFLYWLLWLARRCPPLRFQLCPPYALGSCDRLPGRSRHPSWLFRCLCSAALRGSLIRPSRALGRCDPSTPRGRHPASWSPQTSRESPARFTSRMSASNHSLENRNRIVQPLHFALNPTSFLPQLLQRSTKVSHSLPFSSKNLTHNMPDKYTRKIGLTYLKAIQIATRKIVLRIHCSPISRKAYIEPSVRLMNIPDSKLELISFPTSAGRSPCVTKANSASRRSTSALSPSPMISTKSSEIPTTLPQRLLTIVRSGRKAVKNILDEPSIHLLNINSASSRVEIMTTNHIKHLTPCRQRLFYALAKTASDAQKYFCPDFALFIFPVERAVFG